MSRAFRGSFANLSPSARRVLPGFARGFCLLLALNLTACGPFGYIGKVSQGSAKAFERATQAEAETYAPYEYWAAAAYLERARVMMTYSEYERAFDYSSRAEQLAEAAERRALRVREKEQSQAEASPQASASTSTAAPTGAK